MSDGPKLNKAQQRWEDENTRRRALGLPEVQLPGETWLWLAQQPDDDEQPDDAMPQGEKATITSMLEYGLRRREAAQSSKPQSSNAKSDDLRGHVSITRLIANGLSQRDNNGGNDAA